LGIPIAIDYMHPDRAWLPALVTLLSSNQELRAAGRRDWWIADLLNICQRASPEVNNDVANVTGHGSDRNRRGRPGALHVLTAVAETARQTALSTPDVHISERQNGNHS
jgi:hypothetical protein